GLIAIVGTATGTVLNRKQEPPKVQQDPQAAQNAQGLQLLANGDGFVDRGDIDKAQESYIAAIAAFPSKSANKTLALDKLGDLQLGAKEYVRAKDTFEKEIAIRQEVQGKQHRDLIKPLDQLGDALSHLGKKEDAATTWIEAINIA